jgi:hypothetical protein
MAVPSSCWLWVGGWDGRRNRPAWVLDERPAGSAPRWLLALCWFSVASLLSAHCAAAIRTARTPTFASRVLAPAPAPNFPSSTSVWESPSLRRRHRRPLWQCLAGQVDVTQDSTAFHPQALHDTGSGSSLRRPGLPLNSSLCVPVPTVFVGARHHWRAQAGTASPLMSSCCTGPERVRLPLTTVSAALAPEPEAEPG